MASPDLSPKRRNKVPLPTPAAAATWSVAAPSALCSSNSLAAPSVAPRLRAASARSLRGGAGIGTEFRRVLFMSPVQFPDHNMWSGNYGSQGAAEHWFTTSTTAREASPPRFACKRNGRHERQRVRKLLAARVAHPDTA